MSVFRAASTMSGGERVRLSVARAILGGQVTVVLDEPTAHLDGPTAAALLRDVDRALVDRGVVFIGHDPSLGALGPVHRVEPADQQAVGALGRVAAEWIPLL